jgi:uncharacterized membrane protein
MKKIIVLICILLLATTVSAATLKGSIYDTSLDLEKDVLIEINQQKFLSKDGSYQFTLDEGTYELTARKGLTEIKEDVVVKGDMIYDVFLLADFKDEDELWKETDDDLFADAETDEKWPLWKYILGGLIAAWALIRFGKARVKYGSLGKFKKQVKAEQKKTVAEHKRDIANEPSYVEKAFEIIKKHDGRISQKQLRKEMLPLSEAKISLIVTELKHADKVVKVKKGRGNVILVK